MAHTLSDIQNMVLHMNVMYDEKDQPLHCILCHNPWYGAAGHDACPECEPKMAESSGT